MKHREKLRLARRMMSREEIKKHTPPFQSKWWTNRAQVIQSRIKSKKQSISIYESWWVKLINWFKNKFRITYATRRNI